MPLFDFKIKFLKINKIDDTLFKSKFILRLNYYALIKITQRFYDFKNSIN